ncbi:lipid IV(A) 3-deoxy-D-manno-octulosonic acid transferase [Photobacterium atrarenae]|uniref:3-deoxy-D-manno-octulosonic acid transferase n=1 Tax=Photobacterium atrarenae TaxID=865757 RepID=A0ABY5GFK3_9GAMM|nr:lipid IV(A) 3-deoxy-D-manno-octulosonic acid transferase [Photobacterium atrarenae]UTV27900.1 lipid IV(A) 3-deoxy-D-manno-octulosonic acid transferase [Photobacterium atrarenae]
MILKQLYSLLLYLAAPALLLKLYRTQPGKPTVGKRWPEHFGWTPPPKADHPVWIHAVSVGETLAVTPLIKQLKATHPTLPILLTTTTPTGAEQAAKLGELVEHRYMPLDFSWAVKRFLQIVRPRALYIMETELWPNTLAATHDAGIPITVMNARLSERSCQRYAKVQSLFTQLARHITRVLCQHQDDAARFARLGLRPEQLCVTGSIKFDITPAVDLPEQAASLRQQLGRKRPIWIAASTHRGEDEQVLQAHQTLMAQYPEALLILVPRHPERFHPVFEQCQSQGFTVVRRTSRQPVAATTQVYLADTMGEMMLLLASSDVAFIGGSLIGDRVGGHNLLEPAALARPVLTGPSYFNFTDITQQLIAAEGAAIVANSEHLAQQLIALFAQPVLQAQMGQAALAVVQRNQGALSRTLAALDLPDN